MSSSKSNSPFRGKMIRDALCEAELKEFGNQNTLTDQQIQWQCMFERFFKEDAVDYLKTCGCFSERDWRKNFKALSLKQFHSECAAYGDVDSIFIECKKRRTTTMQIGDMSLPRIPPTIGGLDHLSTLYLYNLDVRTLPDEIGDLKALKALMIKNLPITSLPETVTKLGLIQLYVNGTMMHKFDLSLASSKLGLTLKELMLQNNKLLQVDSSFSSLNLERLDVSGNIGLEELPSPSSSSLIN
jgi:Leucine-rich repeat (LRR) protein